MVLKFIVYGMLEMSLASFINKKTGEILVLLFFMVGILAYGLPDLLESASLRSGLALWRHCDYIFWMFVLIVVWHQLYVIECSGFKFTEVVISPFGKPCYRKRFGMPMVH